MFSLSWLRCSCLLFVISLGCFSYDNLQFVDYPISLYSRDSYLSTLLWLRPAYCFYEKWLMDAVDPGQADKSTAAIEVQIKLADDNETYKLPQSYQVPPCSPIFQEPSAVLQFAYQMGPSIMWLNDSLVRSVLPGHSYRVRYVLYNQAKEQVAASNWSQSFQTRDSAMGQWPGMTGKVLALFLGAAGVLVCLLLLIYCFYSRSHRKEMFSHRRLYEGGFEDPVLHLDTPMDHYDFFSLNDQDRRPAPASRLQEPGSQETPPPQEKPRPPQELIGLESLATLDPTKTCI
uniref:Golgi-associated olfactory signaling regulator isoform X2 n=1 Tax=Geotrypetes seraphini TaxID=260995 RepID=A0A6P8SCM2_GEOSA|nr:Golgi-associated olfactory signaling regulator isoform X2 [Geotrypetes seraphini]